MQISVVIGDIVRQPDCDAIVNSANQNLRAGSGVCGAIYRAAGPALEPCSTQLAPLDVGQAVITPGFELPNRYVIHALGPKFFIDEDPPGQLAAAMRNTLLLADQYQVARVAIPAISMGIFAYPQEEAVPILVKTAKGMATQLKYVEEARFVVMDETLFKRFSNEIQKAK